jgi:hypothetical protein
MTAESGAQAAGQTATRQRHVCRKEGAMQRGAIVANKLHSAGGDIADLRQSSAHAGATNWSLSASSSATL